MQPTEQTLQTIKHALAKLLTQMPSTQQNEIGLQLNSIWHYIRKLIICRKDELEEIEALCDDIINLSLQGKCQKLAVISNAAAILELTHQLGQITPYLELKSNSSPQLRDTSVCVPPKSLKS